VDHLGPHHVRRVEDRAAGRHTAAAGEGADAEGHGGRVSADHRDPVERHVEGVGGDLGERRLVALARAHRAGGDQTAAAQVERDTRALERTDGGALDVAGDPDPAPDPARPQRRLLGAERRVAGGVQRRVERGPEVAGVVHERIAIAIRHPQIPREIGRGQIVAASDLGRIDAELAREPVDGAVHGEHRLRPAGAAVRRVGRLLRDHRLDLHGQIAHAMRAQQVRDRVVGKHDAPHVVGPEVEPDVIAHGQDRPVAPGGQADAVRLMAGVGRAHHVLAPALDPLHRATQRDRRAGTRRSSA
jgi:hypothetical protein